MSLARNAAASVYSLESVGSIAGGILVNFILIFLLRPFQSLSLIILLVTLIIGTVGYRSGLKTTVFLAGAGSILLAGFVLFIHPDRLSRKFLFPQQDLVYYKDTPCGNLVVTHSAGQLNFYENNSLLFSTNNAVNNEEATHYALLQRKSHDTVLLLGGGLSGVLREILKYPVKQLEYVEINPWIIRLGEQFEPGLSNPEVHIYRGDATQYLRRTRLHFDAVLCEVPEPATLQANRFYTYEFLSLLKSRLKPGGVISLSLMPTQTYVGNEALPVQACMFTTLRELFDKVVIIPGEKNYFLASDSLLRSDMAQLAAERQIPTDYVNGFYLDDDLLQQRSREIMWTVSVKAPVNHDFRPALFYAQLQYWRSYFGHTTWIIPLIVLLILLPCIFRAGGIQAGMFATGFTASSIEILLLFVFQVIFGYVYLMAGILITVFMAGLALGAASGNNLIPNPTYGKLVLLQFCTGFYSLIVMGCIFMFKNLHPGYLILQVFIILLILGIALLAGLQFQMSTAVKKGSPLSLPGSVYSADLLGASVGALLISAFLVPVTGIFGSLFLIAGLNLIAGLWMILKRE